jgi:hypothetical protein
MSLPATIGVTRLSDLSSVTFGDKDTVGDKTEYYAPSPNGDLAGRLKLTVEHQVTKQGIARSVVTIIEPKFDADSGTYPRFIKAVVTLNRSELDSLESVTDPLKMLIDAFGTVGSDALPIAYVNQTN